MGERYMKQQKYRCLNTMTYHDDPNECPHRDEESRECLIEIVFPSGNTGGNQSRLAGELDNFWTYGPRILSHETRDSTKKPQAWLVEADSGFLEAFQNQHQLGGEVTAKSV